jgi:hypothetical protein
MAEIFQIECDPGEMLEEISQGKREMGRVEITKLIDETVLG